MTDEELRASFRALTGVDAQGLWSAPGRVNLIGEHTDYNGGYVLPFAIDLRTRVAAARRDDGVLRVYSLQRPGEAPQLAIDDLAPAGQRGGEHTWADYAFGTVWALRTAGHDVGGLDLVIDGGVPTGSGLSSSAAMECAVGLAALDLHDVALPLETLARLAQHAENDYVGMPCGLLDQMAVAVCRAGHVLFYDIGDDVREQVPFAPVDDGLAVLVVNTRAQHAHASGEYAARRHSCEQAARELDVRQLGDVSGADLDDALRRLDDEELRRRVRHIVTEDERVLAVAQLLRADRLPEIGPLMSASHASLRDDFEVSCDELDVTVDAALAAGALGARMTGGGFGGCAIALLPAEAVDEVGSAVTEAFARRGWLAPVLFTPSSADGVARHS